MGKGKRRGVCAALITLICMCIAGCGGVQNDVLAGAKGQEITRTQIKEAANAQLYSYNMSYDTIGTLLPEAEAVELMESVMDKLIADIVVQTKAQEEGLTLSDQEEADAKRQTEEYTAYIKKTIQDEMYREGFGMDEERNITSTPEERDEEFKARYGAFWEKSGITEAYIHAAYRNNLLSEKLRTRHLADFTVTKEDLRAYYDTEVALQQQKDEEDPEGALAEYIEGAPAMTLYVPRLAEEKVRYAKHILIRYPAEVADAIGQKRLEISKLTEEAALAAAQKELDALYAEGGAHVLARANEAYEKARQGEDFDALIELYGEDPGMEGNEKGYLVSDASNYVREFIDGALALEKEGDVSPPIASPYGYHIIRIAHIPVAGALPYEAVQEEMHRIVPDLLREAHWQQLIQTWSEAYGVWRKPFYF
jgi:foldase protein PrsA